MNEVETRVPITLGDRAIFEAHVNSTHIGDSLKSMLRFSPEPFSEKVNTKVPNVPPITLTIQGTKDSFIFSEQNIVTIGRMDEAHEVIPSLDLNPYGGTPLGVSRRHAKISYQQGKFYLMDLNSSNGTWINEHKLAPRQMMPIYDGDILSFGQFKLIVSLKN